MENFKIREQSSNPICFPYYSLFFLVYDLSIDHHNSALLLGV
jgi:hypothetical protein